MCGIVGIVDRVPLAPDTGAKIQAMADALRHRGPDGEGYWRDSHAAFGHRRLSIVDLSANGRQPMSDTDGRVHLVCNGEIYNHEELRRALGSYPFRSRTDVEVILPLFRSQGPDCVRELVGMFAFAVWDATDRELLLVRDRIGEKPLYYAEIGSALAFASEIKALLTLPDLDRTIDPTAFVALLAQPSIPPPKTAYRAIRQLAPGQLLLWRDGRTQVRTYWRPDYSGRRPMSAGEALDRYGAVMRDAVRRQMLADVPVGVMLSGGVDSSTIARFAAEQSDSVRTFCVGFDRPGAPDPEFARAKQAAAVLKVRHQNVNLPDLDFGHAVATLAHYDQPMASLVALYADRLAAAMSREVKVVLSGNGADEVFAGYAAYARLPMAAQLGGLLRHLPMALLPAQLRKIGALGLLTAPEQRRTMLDRGAISLADRLATPRLKELLRAHPAAAPVAAAAMESGACTLLDAALAGDLLVSHQHGHALIADMAGMAHGLELRAPFLDHRVIEFAAALPTALLLGLPPRVRDTKLVVKRHLEQVLPASLVRAPKIGFGFNIDLAARLRGAWRAGVERLLLKGAYLDLGLFHREGARWALDHSYAGAALLLSTAIWAETRLAGRSVEDVARLDA